MCRQRAALAPLLPSRRSWQQPGSLSGGPSGQEEEVHWQPSQGTEPAPRARTQAAPSVLGKAGAGPLEQHLGLPGAPSQSHSPV